MSLSLCILLVIVFAAGFVVSMILKARIKPNPKKMSDHLHTTPSYFACRVIHHWHPGQPIRPCNRNGDGDARAILKAIALAEAEISPAPVKRENHPPVADGPGAGEKK